MKEKKIRIIHKLQPIISFNNFLKIFALLFLLLIIFIFFTLLNKAYPSIKQYGLQFLFSQTWDPSNSTYGALPFIVGTLMSSLLALVISIPFSLAIAILLGEYFTSGIFSSSIKTAIELIAGIPSIIYGLWALFILVPIIRSFQMKIGVMPYGLGIFTSSIVLAIMIIPYSASIGREIISMCPSDLKEAALSLGATRYEVIRKIILPYSRSGIISGTMLAFGRAIGETMAVTIVIGNSNYIPTSIFSPAQTLASLIANEFSEATDTLHFSSLVYIAFILFILTVIINLIGRYIINKTKVQ